MKTSLIKAGTAVFNSRICCRPFYIRRGKPYVYVVYEIQYIINLTFFKKSLQCFVKQSKAGST